MVVPQSLVSSRKEPPPAVRSRSRSSAACAAMSTGETCTCRVSMAGGGSFRELTSDCGTTMEIVARFLALLDLYRDGEVSCEQVTPLGELRVRWTAAAADR